MTVATPALDLVRMRSAPSLLRLTKIHIATIIGHWNRLRVGFDRMPHN